MKHRLRHPIRAIREPFGTAGLIVAMIALVAALGGTALAAAKLNSTQKKEVEKIAKKFAGKPGAPGANGSNGSPGAKGDAGAAGGTGPAGTSVISSVESSGGSCPKGGSKFVAGATTTFACNGATGAPGLPGPEGNIKATLPSGSTETGAWGIFEGVPAYLPISFTIPLETELNYTGGCETNPVEASCQIHYINESTGKEINGLEEEVTPLPQCPGSAAEPEAEPGNLCVYGGSASSNDSLIEKPAGGNGAGITGALLVLAAQADRGTWAVTAP